MGRLRPILVLSLFLTVFAAVPGTSLARFTRTAAVGGNTFSTPTNWPYFLHNSTATPAVPPAGNGNAITGNMVMTTVAPTATTLYDYSVNCGASALGGRAVTATGTCNTATWRTPALTRTVTVAVLSIWTRGTAGTFQADVRRGTTSLATAIVSVAGQAQWTLRVVSIPLPTTNLNNQRISLRITGQAGITGARIAYDTRTYYSYLWLT
jgi:hypothetical protein